MKVLAIIPALNEEASISKVIEDLKTSQLVDSILIVDDGSVDKTSEIAALTGVRVIKHKTNLGVGAAIKTGFQYALEHDFNFALQFDADGQHRADQIGILLDNIGNLDILIGGRVDSKGEFRSSYSMSRTRKMAIKVLSGLVSTYVGEAIADSTSGFRLYSQNSIKFFSENFPNKYLGDTVESLFIAHNQGLHIGQVGIQMNERMNGKPSQTSIRAGIRFMEMLLRIMRYNLQKTNQ